jgi:exopolysaccharide biosynthesis polyprenyl glycosylphosphotransferase
MSLGWWGLSAWLFGIQQVQPLRGLSEQARDVLAAALFAGLASATAWWLLAHPPPLPALATFWLLHLIGAGLSRLLLRAWLRGEGPWSRSRRVALIAGTGTVARRLAQRLTRAPEYGIVVRGFVSDSEGEVGRVYEGAPVVGVLPNLATIVETGVDMVLLCLPSHLEPHTEKLLHELRNSTVDVKLVPSIAATETLGLDAYMFEGFPMLTLQAAGVHGWHQAGKRLLDVVGAAAGLLLTAPLLVIIAACIKASSPGPVLYRQVRMSLDGQPFVMLKFRTMHEQAERETGPVWAVPKDPRVTKVGRLLRRTSLDELPQLWNVLKGEMSLVGPRPERPTYVETFRVAYPDYMLRLKVKAGMTGWAQINGWRGNTCLQHRIAHDLYYIQHWSLWFDLKILCQTLWKGVLHENAY